MIAECRLCKNTMPLVVSHLLPSFVGRWLKGTSSTGFLRKASSPNKRTQDLEKRRLLCTDCEQRLSRSESLFAGKMFHPYVNRALREFDYGPWLLEFSVSLSWRTAITNLDASDAPPLRQDLRDDVIEACGVWADFLLRRRTNIEPYEQHLLLLDFIEDPGDNPIPEKFQWYTMRGCDSTLAASQHEIFAYTKLPRFLFWAPIRATGAIDWFGTEILAGKGYLGPPQSVSQVGFGDFLLSRVRASNAAMSTLSDKQRKLIEETFLRAPLSLDDDGVRVHLAERELRETVERRRKHSPP